MRLQIERIGSDCEVFLQDSKGTIRSAEGLLGGTKEKPRPVIAPGFALQEDNVLAEFNIPPSNSAKTFSTNVAAILDYLNGELHTKGFSIAPKISSAEMLPDDVATKQGRTFGCDPDFCVWTRSTNPTPEARNPRLRTAGGHIHVSFSAENDEMGIDHQMAAVKALDVFLGVPSVLIDSDTRRRELYGKAGAFRVKEYGIEYRVLSNFWAFSPEYRSWVFTNTVGGFAFLRNRGAEEHLEACSADIVNCINTGDVELAKRIVRDFGVYLPETVYRKVFPQ